MKTLLLNMPRFNMVKVTRDWFVDLGEISSFPPIGLMYIAAYIRRFSNHQVKIVDSVASGMSYADIEALFKKEMPDVLGITAFTYTLFDILKTIKLAKEINPKIIVVLGGPHVSIFWEETFFHKEVDYMIIGDGEKSFLELLNALETEGAVSKIPGLIYRENNKIQKNEPQPILNLDELPFPAFDLLDSSKYYSTLGRRKTVGTICTSRGCPFQCTYCLPIDKTYRARKPENVVDEIELYLKNGINDFFFFDDTFNITDKRAILMSKEILKRGLNITWAFRGRVNAVSDEMFRIAKEAGCHLVLFGIEDYTNENLKRIKKGITIEDGRRAVKLAKKHKIETSTNWIIGFPHHKEKGDIYNLLNTAKKINADYAQFSILQLLPHSAMYYDCIKEGKINRNTWIDFVKNPPKEFYVELYEKYFSREELAALYEICYQKYYLRLFYIIKNIFKIKSLDELKIKLKVFLKVFFPR